MGCFPYVCMVYFYIIMFHRHRWRWVSLPCAYSHLFINALSHTLLSHGNSHIITDHGRRLGDDTDKNSNSVVSDLDEQIKTCI